MGAWVWEPAAVVVLDETVEIMDYLHNSCQFFAHESCGQCTPCREGDILGVENAPADSSGPRTACGPRSCWRKSAARSASSPGSTICGLGRRSGVAVEKTRIAKFRDELQAYIRRTNPEGFQQTTPAPAPGIPGTTLTTALKDRPQGRRDNHHRHAHGDSHHQRNGHRDWRSRVPQRDSSGASRGGRDPALLLAPGA